MTAAASNNASLIDTICANDAVFAILLSALLPKDREFGIYLMGRYLRYHGLAHLSACIAAIEKMMVEEPRPEAAR